ncbi:uncharacterized protein LOC113562460 [Ooceraea biroi]|uniref:uncharacterized protein LOC113562460 n=1 Tax=Ooceraea biroi TaxID=2015173 RepID=UPI000F0849DF|nr:uncharacterized protein LOC113562460 [Ooceraea biroi]
MPKRKFKSHISTRYRRKLIREESDTLCSLIFNEECTINSQVILSNSASESNHDDLVHVNPNNASAIVQEIINSSFSEQSNISEPCDVSLNNVSLHEAFIGEENTSEKEDDDFKAFLVQWAITHHISHAALSHLLSGLRKAHPIFQNLPKCVKTLLRTPRSSVITDILPGQYYHCGTQYGILQFLSQSKNNKVSSPIQIQIGIDGLPISQSNSNQLWPILGRIIPYQKVFLIGCDFGKAKPANANEFLQSFVNDMNILINEDITYNETTYSVSIHSIICDAPAKSFITLTKGHTGYFSCSKCTTEGNFIDNRICFPDFDGQNRTDASFRN